MDVRLQNARSLYDERSKIALAAFIAIFAVTCYLFYSPGIYTIGIEPPEGIPSGWVRGFEVVYSFNTAGFILAVSLMVFVYGFWQWAFLPAPAATYTMAVLEGLYGSRAIIERLIGKRFRIKTGKGSHIDITCRIKESGTDQWFTYEAKSSRIRNPRLENLALRHGMHVKNDRITSWMGNDELHSRLILMSRAMRLATSLP
ncbi:hypothetical protein EU538_03410 [Candidatus Thorarchaeota archaeon]|nr:MAG: hypothetical protein EU538_03410 [Candidatus Thorarchaeota archaeon]